MAVLRKCGLNTNNAGKELQPHGTSDFPCAGYEADYTSAPEGIIPWHRHSEPEIGFITGGVMLLKTPGETCLLSGGDIFVLNGNTFHYAEGTPKCSLRSLVFSPLLLTGDASSVFSAKYIDPLMRSPDFSCIILSEDLQAQTAFTTAFEALKYENFAYEFTVREQISHIMLELCQLLKVQAGFKEKKHSIDSLRLERMMAFIHDHYNESISLAEISAAGQVGEREALRCFKRAIGESPIQYLLKYRLMQSAHMLGSDPRCSISAVAEACGFEESSYFSKQFKRFYNRTPREYKNEAEHTPQKGQHADHVCV